MPSLIKNFFYNSLLTVANLAFPLVVLVYISRTIGPDGLGKVNFAATIASYFVLFGLFGVGSYGIREIARSRDNRTKLKKTFNELFCLNCLTVALSLVAYIVFALLNTKTRAEPRLYMINGVSIILALFSFDWLFQGLENYRYISLRSIMVKACSLVLIFVFVKNRTDYVIYALLNVVGLSANYLFNAYYAGKIVGFDFRGIDISRHFPTIFRFALISVATSLYLGMDKLFLGFISGDYYVGLYTPADKIARMSLSLVAALSAVLFPRLSNVLAQGDEKRAVSIVADSLHLLLLIAVPIFVGVEILARPIVSLLSGSDFIAAVPTLRIEALIIIPVTIANVAGIQVLIASGRENKYLISIIAGTFAFLGCALLFVPRFRQNGAALGIVAAESVGAAFELFYARDYFKKAFSPSWISRIAVSALAMGVMVLIISRLHLSSLLIVGISVTAGALVYAILLFIFRDSMMAFFRKKLKMHGDDR
jgi:O-antigen/teichoic acid export membrane protein